MILRIFSVRDRATVQFGNPMFLITEGQAVRAFSDEINRSDPNNALYAHPDDYDLYYFGEFDSNTGLITSDVPVQVIAGKSVSTRLSSN